MRRLLISLVLAMLLGVGFLATASAAEKSPRTFKPQSQPRGLSYGEWQVRWFQWQFGTAAGIAAALDETGANCTEGLQPQRVWFSTIVTHSGTTTRSCTLPAGTALFILTVANECSDIEPPPFFGTTEAELRECAASGFDEFFSGPVSLTVDGVAVQNLRSFRTQTPLFQYTLPVDNLYGFPAGTTATAAINDGMFVMLKPLHPGQHTIVIHIESDALGNVDEIYNVTISPGHQGVD
jgi:hypothetical protein